MSGLLQRKIEGVVKAKNTYEEPPKLDNKTEKEVDTLKAKLGKSNQKVTIKLPENIKKQIEALKKVKGLKYDYEAIEFALSKSSETLSPEEAKIYKILTDLP